jgi:hypothetical protein
MTSKLTILGGLGYLKFLAPPEWILRWIEGKLNLLGRLPHYVSVDQKTYGRYGVLPTTNAPLVGSATGDIGLSNLRGSNQRLGPWSTVSYILYFNPCTKTMHNVALGDLCWSHCRELLNRVTWLWISIYYCTNWTQKLINNRRIQVKILSFLWAPDRREI